MDNCWLPFAQLQEQIRVSVKIRYRAQAREALVSPNGDGTVTIDFDDPEWGVTPGQSAVFYQDDLLIGGGTIIA